MQLDEVVPWGRSFTEYRQMFSLTDADLEKEILGCGDGPASFNAELTQRGGRVTSVDPLYQFSAAQIEERIEETSALVLEQVRLNREQFVWRQISSLQQLAQIRHSSMRTFIEDFSAGIGQGRYLAAQLPILPFVARRFELALCSHLLFLYSEQLSYVLHLQAICELCRIAAEVRIFPLVDLAGNESIHLSPLLRELERLDYQFKIEPVDYEFQQGGDRMLILSESD